MKFRSKPVEIEATQWFKNGDHPVDDSYLIGSGAEAFLSEGNVVRRYRRPDVAGLNACRRCGKPMDDHGWIDTIQGGHDVCPGDWIITEPNGKGFYPCNPDVFVSKYEPA